eukprot:1760762-Amphidinium_carterae.2
MPASPPGLTWGCCASRSKLGPRLAGRPGPTWDSRASRSNLGLWLAGHPGPTWGSCASRSSRGPARPTDLARYLARLGLT